MINRNPRCGGQAAAITALAPCHGRYQTVSILDFSAGGLQLQGAFGVAQATTSKSSCSRATGCRQKLLGRSAAALVPRLALPLPAIIRPSSCSSGQPQLLQRPRQRARGEASLGQGRRTARGEQGWPGPISAIGPKMLPKRTQAQGGLSALALSALGPGRTGPWYCRPERKARVVAPRTAPGLPNAPPRRERAMAARQATARAGLGPGVCDDLAFGRSLPGA